MLLPPHPTPPQPTRAPGSYTQWLLSTPGTCVALPEEFLYPHQQFLTNKTDGRYQNSEARRSGHRLQLPWPRVGTRLSCVHHSLSPKGQPPARSRFTSSPSLPLLPSVPRLTGLPGSPPTETLHQTLSRSALGEDKHRQTRVTSNHRGQA